MQQQQPVAAAPPRCRRQLRAPRRAAPRITRAPSAAGDRPVSSVLPPSATTTSSAPGARPGRRQRRRGVQRRDDHRQMSTFAILFLTRAAGCNRSARTQGERDMQDGPRELAREIDPQELAAIGTGRLRRSRAAAARKRCAGDPAGAGDPRMVRRGAARRQSAGALRRPGHRRRSTTAGRRWPRSSPTCRRCHHADPRCHALGHQLEQLARYRLRPRGQPVSRLRARLRLLLRAADARLSRLFARPRFRNQADLQARGRRAAGEGAAQARLRGAARWRWAPTPTPTSRSSAR